MRVQIFRHQPLQAKKDRGTEGDCSVLQEDTALLTEAKGICKWVSDKAGSESMLPNWSQTKQLKSWHSFFQGEEREGALADKDALENMPGRPSAHPHTHRELNFHAPGNLSVKFQKFA